MEPATPVTPVTPAAPVTAPTTPPANFDPAKFVSLEQHNALLSRLDGISGKLSVIERGTGAPTKLPVKDDNATLRAELDAIKAESVKTKRDSAIVAAAAGQDFINPEDASMILGPQVMQRDDGTFFVKSFEILPTTGAKIEKELSVQEAVKQLAKDRPTWIKGKVAGGGVGADASKRGLPEILPTNLEDAMKDPNAFAALAKARPDYVKSLPARASK